MSRSHHHGTPKTRHAGGLNLGQIGGQPMLWKSTFGYVTGYSDRNRAESPPPTSCHCLTLTGDARAFDGA